MHRHTRNTFLLIRPNQIDVCITLLPLFAFKSAAAAGAAPANVKVGKLQDTRARRTARLLHAAARVSCGLRALSCVARRGAINNEKCNTRERGAQPARFAKETKCNDV
jgi:hypothetical protein